MILFVSCFANIVCKDNANERNESVLSNCRVQLVLCKITKWHNRMQIHS